MKLRGCLPKNKLPALVAGLLKQAQQNLSGEKPKAGQAADQGAVEADVLQVLADVDFDQRNQLSHVPSLDLIGDKARDAALLVGDKTSQNGNEALIDFGAQLGIAGEHLS